MSSDDRDAERNPRWFLSYLGEPHQYRSRSDQLLAQMDDNRCGCAATCPFHRIPGQQWDVSREKAPWDELKDQNTDG